MTEVISKARTILSFGSEVCVELPIFIPWFLRNLADTGSSMSIRGLPNPNNFILSIFIAKISSLIIKILVHLLVPLRA